MHLLIHLLITTSHHQLALRESIIQFQPTPLPILQLGLRLNTLPQDLTVAMAGGRRVHSGAISSRPLAEGLEAGLRARSGSHNRLMAAANMAKVKPLRRHMLLPSHPLLPG